MDRREFLRAGAGGLGGAGLLGLGLPVLNAEIGPPTSTGLIPADKGLTPALLAALKARGSRRAYRGRARLTIGMPIGGVCAGQVYLLGDGTLGEWQVDGRHRDTGYGSSSYRTQRPGRTLEQGFALRVEDPDGARTQAVLADVEYGGDYDRIEFIGEYPVAEVRYAGSAAALPPVEATLRAYSPFCPLSSADSSIPATVFRWTLRNPTARRLKVRLCGWLQNGVEPDEGADLAPVTRMSTRRTEPGLAGVLHGATPRNQDASDRPDRVLADFEGDDFEGWTVEGEAFGPRPSRGTEPDQQTVKGFVGRGLVNTFRGGNGTVAGDRFTGTATSPEFVIDRRYLQFRIGGGAHAGKTCVNLIVDGQIVRTATGRNSELLEPRMWDLSQFQGRRARVQIVDAATAEWGHVNVDALRLSDAIPESLRRPRPDSPTDGTMAIAVLGAGGWARADWTGSDDTPDRFGDRPMAESVPSSTPVALAGIDVELLPGTSIEVVFILGWCFHNLYNGQGRMYSNRFADAWEVIRHVAADDARLWSQTERFRAACYDHTTLPHWLVQRLFMPVSILASATCQWWKNGRFWAWEGAGCCHGTCTHVWNYAHAEARLFPDLARSTRTMQDLGSAFDERTGRVSFRGEVSGGFEYAADGQSGTVLKMYREHLCSADGSFLRAHWPRIKMALEYQIRIDALGAATSAPRGRADTRPPESIEHLPTGSGPDGVIHATQHNTYDINFEGPNTYVGSLYLAALLAGERMAKLMDDAEAAGRYRSLFESGRRWTEANLFNGEYFTQRVPPGGPRQWQYEEGCLSDQLFGQNWSRTLDLGSVYDEGAVRRAYASVFRYNWAPAVGAYNGAYPPERYFARDREGGLFVCTWPKGGRAEDPVRYRDEVWTGCEYQVAAGFVWEGMLDEGLAIVKAVDERYDGAMHNPWNEVECGDHYARAMASYGVLQALSGFVHDGPAGILGLAPRMTPDDFASFFAASEGWGVLKQRRVDGVRQESEIRLDWGRLRVREFVTVLPPGAVMPRATLVMGEHRDPIPVRKQEGAFPDGRWSAVFPRELVLTADGIGTAIIRWEW
ncbi:MAG: hypothetical protein JNM07_00195 [Phycisphaerae bacterium]|nr:hypothetical protein [Phycisphaerae bacterium]